MKREAYKEILKYEIYDMAFDFAQRFAEKLTDEEIAEYLGLVQKANAEDCFEKLDEAFWNGMNTIVDWRMKVMADV